MTGRAWDVEVLDHRDPSVAAELVAVQRRSYRVEADLIGFEGMPGLTETADEVRRLELTVLGVRDGGALVGAAGYAVEDGVVDIDRVVVDPPHFRRGIGRALLRAVAAATGDATAIEVMTGAGNTPAVHLYRSLGFDLVATEVSLGVEVVHFRRDPTRRPVR